MADTMNDFNNSYNQKILKNSISRLENGQGIVHEIIEENIYTNDSNTNK